MFLVRYGKFLRNSVQYNLLHTTISPPVFKIPTEPQLLLIRLSKRCEIYSFIK